MVVFFVKGDKTTHLVQLRASLDLRQNSGSEAQHVKRWRRAQRKRGKKMCAAVKNLNSMKY